MARKPTPTPAKALEESLGEWHPSTDAEMRLPMWLRGNMLPRHVADPVEQVFLSDELPAPLANLWALVNLAQGAGGGILTVRRDHGTIPDALAPSLFVRNVVFMLRCARDDVLQQTAAANIPVFSARLDGLIVATKATLDAFMGDKLDRIWCDDPTCDNRGQHLLPGPWIEAWERSADAGADALLLSAFMLGDATSTLSVSPALPPGAEAIDANDAALLAFLNRHPSLRRMIADVLPDKGPQDRKAVAKRMRKLADRTPALVDYPKDGRSGVAILPAGVEALKRATAPMPR